MNFNNRRYKKRDYFSEILKKTKLSLSCFGAVITRYFSPYNRADKTDKNKIKSKTFQIILHTLLSFFLGLSNPGMDIYPFGLSMLISSYGQMSAFSFIGAASSTLFSGTDGLIHFISFFLIYLIRKNLSRNNFNESHALRVTIGLASSLFIGLCSLFTEKITGYAFLAFTAYVMLTVFCTYLFYAVLCKKKAKVSNSMYTLSVYSICVCLIPAFNRFSFFGIDLALILASLITLWISKQKGPVYGCVSGFVMGFACSNPLFSAPLGIGGLLSGYLFTKSTASAIAAFPISAFFSGIYLFGTSVIGSLLPFTTVAGLIYFIIYRYIPDIFSVKAIISDKIISEKQKTSEFDRVSDSLSGLSSIIYKFAEHLKAPSSAETGEVFDNAFSCVCDSCSMSSLCYAKRECNFSAVRSKTVSILRSKPLKEDELSAMLLGKCIKIRELCENINSAYSELNFLTMKSNRTGTVACLYNSMSHLIKSTSKTEDENKQRDARLEKSITQALLNIGVEFSYVTVSGTRHKEILVHGVRADKIPCSSEDLSDYLSNECCIKLSEPVFDISDNADMIMKFTRGEIISLEYAQCCEAKYDTEVNGDTISLFDSEKGYFYSIIADGMGNGKTAAATSRLSCVFLEKMLSAGTAKNVCLEMLNNLLLSKNDETFSSVDLLEIDKLGGSAYFIKAGAAPSFVLRKNHLYKICSETPPVGIIPVFSAESTRFTLEKGDVIFMMSDGVIQSDSDALWLSELIHVDSQNEPALLARELIDRAKKLNERKDDASACVIKII